MNDIEKTFERNINEDKILKLNKTKFMESFFKGSDYEEDYTYLRNELPEFLPKLQVDDTWIDSKKIKRIAKNDYFIITGKINTKQENVILGEIKFDEKGKVLFARYNKQGLFRRTDSFIINGKEILRGTIPNSEYCCPVKNSLKLDFDFTIENKVKDVFDIKYTNFSDKLYISLKTATKEITLKIFYEESEKSKISLSVKKAKDMDSLFLFKEKAYDSLYEYFDYSIDDKEISKYKKDLIKIKDLHRNLQYNGFKENELNTYLEIYNIFKKLKDI